MMPSRSSGTQRLHKLEGVKKSDSTIAITIGPSRGVLRAHSPSQHTLYATLSWVECARNTRRANGTLTEQMPQWILFPESWPRPLAKDAVVLEFLLCSALDPLLIAESGFHECAVLY